jgi:hypothetical protein
VGFISLRVDFHQLAAPNLANSAVLKMLEEEEKHRGGKGKSFVEFCNDDDSILPGRLDKLTSVIWTGHFHRAPWKTGEGEKVVCVKLAPLYRKLI